MVNSQSLNSKLISCPDCGKQVSRRADFCPHCGCPAEAIKTEAEIEHTTEELSPPLFTDDLSIGECPSMQFKRAFITTLGEGDSSIDGLSPGHISTFYHEHGLRLKDQKSSHYDIHYSQIINVKYMDRTSLIQWIQKDKSVVGRAIVGALICGPVGAIVGGISGVGEKREGAKSHCLVVNFWAVDSNKNATPNTIILSGVGILQKNGFQLIADKINENKIKKAIPVSGNDSCKWFVKTKSKIIGPIAYEEVMKLYNDNEINDKTLLRKAGQDYALKFKQHFELS